MPAAVDRAQPRRAVAHDDRNSDDTALLAAVAAGDHAAFTALYERHGAALYQHAYRLLGERETAEDVLQAVFLNVWRRAADFDPARGAAWSWLYGSTRHAVVDAARRRAVQLRGATTIEVLLGFPGVDDTAALAERSELGVAIQRELGALPDAQRESIELAYFAELSCEEIAARMVVPLGTAKGRLRLGRTKLRAVLAPLATD